MAKRKSSDIKKVIENPWVRFAFLVGLIIALLYFIYFLRSILLPFLLAFLIAYLLDPLVTNLSKKHIPRAAVAGLFVIILIFLFIAGLTIFIPKIVGELIGFMQKLPDYLIKLQELIDPLIKKFQAQYPVELDKLSRTLSTEFQHKLPDIAEAVTNIVANAFTSVMNFILGFLKLIIIPIFTFFLMKDIDKIKARVKEYLPYKYKNYIIELYHEIDLALGGFIRGQLLIGLIAGTIYCIGFILIGVPYGLILGILIGIVNFVPYLGLLLGVIPALLLTYLEYMSFSKIFLIFLLYLCQQALDGFIITPNILGHAVGLHPVAILMSLLIFGKLFGLIGILIAVPATAVIKVFFIRTIKVYKLKQDELARAANRAK